jgi:uncharacterized protein
MITPCNNICRLDKTDICIGCGRTIEEIGFWKEFDDQQRQKNNRKMQ